MNVYVVKQVGGLLDLAQLGEHHGVAEPIRCLERDLLLEIDRFGAHFVWAMTALGSVLPARQSQKVKYPTWPKPK